MSFTSISLILFSIVFYFFPHFGSGFFFHDNNVAGAGLVFGIWFCELIGEKENFNVYFLKKFGINKLYSSSSIETTCEHLPKKTSDQELSVVRLSLSEQAINIHKL